MQLILQQQGTTLGVKDGAYQIRHPEGKRELSPGQVKGIALHPGTRVTHEAVLIALAHETEVLFVDRKGFPQARVWSPRYGSIATIRKHQALFARSREALPWVQVLLGRKLDNQLAILSMLPEWDHLHRHELARDQQSVEALREQLAQVSGPELAPAAGKLRNLEARASRRYWQAITRALPEPYRFDKRSQHPARDMFNCLLNYGYGMLYGIVEGALIQAGLDPYLGFFHRDEYNRPSLAFDCIEPYRVWVDYVVIKLCMDQVIFREFFEIDDGGAYWLAPSGKQLLIPSVNEYLAEVVPMDGQSRSRREHIYREARALAARLKSPFAE